MSTEQQAISTSVSCQVKKFTQKPLSIKANGLLVTVHPANASVMGAPGKVASMGHIDVFYGGGSVKIEGGQSVVAPYFISSWELLYSWSPNGGSAAISYDGDTGTFYADSPVYACIYIPPQTVTCACYMYIPHVKTFVSGGNPQGFAVTQGVIIASLPGSVIDDRPPQITTADIAPPAMQDSGGNDYSRYKIHVDTILTSEGEWIKPKNFESSDYDPDNAYGSGVRGPDKEGSWVQKEHLIEEGFITDAGNMSIKQHDFPKVYGVNEIAGDYEVRATINGNFGGVEAEHWGESEVKVTNRVAMYNATIDPQDVTIPPPPSD